MKDDDELFFVDEDIEEQLVSRTQATWKLLIVDDDPSIHNVTRLALEDFAYNDKKLEIINAYSATEAKEVLLTHPEIAVILLDVVMEHDQAGLELVKYIREELHNPFVRIILRTGQPGQAPEREVILNYDINDYKEKTELTAKKLFTSLVAALRTYNDLMIINRYRLGLEKVIDSTASLFKEKSLEKFITGLLEQLLSILNLNGCSFYSHTSAFVSHNMLQMVNDELDRHIIVAGTGFYEDKINQKVKDVVDHFTLSKITQAELNHQTLYFDTECVIHFKYMSKYESFVYLRGSTHLNELDKRLIERFCNSVTIAYESIFSDELISSNTL
jgi:CheY-like chemotaxis protein